VARVEEEEKKEGGVGLRPYLDLLASSAADPRVVDLRAARVEPDHHSSACGRAQDLAGTPLVDLRRTSTEPPFIGRSATEATRRWRVHPTVSAHTGEGLRAVPRACSLRRHSSVAQSHRCGAREGAEEK
jgi:hypothetical protein